MKKTLLRPLLVVALCSEDASKKKEAINKTYESIREHFKNELAGYLFETRGLTTTTYPDARDLISDTFLAFMEKVVNGTWDIGRYKDDEHLENGVSRFMYETINGLAKKAARKNQKILRASQILVRSNGEGYSDDIEERWPDPNSENKIIDSITDTEYMALVQSVFPSMPAKYVDIVVLQIEFHGYPPTEKVKDLMVDHGIATEQDYRTAKHRAIKSLSTKLDFLRKRRKMRRGSKAPKKNEKTNRKAQKTER